MAVAPVGWQGEHGREGWYLVGFRRLFEPRAWGRAQRLAALKDMERRFQRPVTEAQVFQAADLFFSLLADDSLVDKHALAARVRRDWEIACQRPPETESSC